MRVEFGRVNEDHTQLELKRGFIGDEGEVDNENVEGGRDGDEGCVTFEEGEAGPEAKSKGVGEVEGLIEGEASVDVFRSIDDESGGDRDGEQKPLMSLREPEFRLVGARMRALSHGLGVFTFLWGRMMDRCEKESPLAILRPGGRGWASYPGLGLRGTPSY
ncbi:hypothetical protein CRG98_000531 [Punica granatum]|uniref:Uncharacterized protein n=1 Tax=Punica granatum TaxID=22663 RepID=A0A2I0LEG5_PUNGR|nr:hypothetical protein CRG98_000531 [Punica granatum]